MSIVFGEWNPIYRNIALAAIFCCCYCCCFLLLHGWQFECSLFTHLFKAYAYLIYFAIMLEIFIVLLQNRPTRKQLTLEQTHFRILYGENHRENAMNMSLPNYPAIGWIPKNVRSYNKSLRFLMLTLEQSQ